MREKSFLQTLKLSTTNTSSGILTMKNTLKSNSKVSWLNAWSLHWKISLWNRRTTIWFNKTSSSWRKSTRSKAGRKCWKWKTGTEKKWLRDNKSFLLNWKSIAKYWKVRELSKTSSLTMRKTKKLKFWKRSSIPSATWDKTWIHWLEFWLTHSLHDLFETNLYQYLSNLLFQYY